MLVEMIYKFYELLFVFISRTNYKMCKSKGALVILALFFCCWISVASTEDGSDKTLELLKNVTINNDFDSFQKILQSIDLKNVFANPAVQEGFKKFNIDVSVLANVKTKDYLKVRLIFHSRKLESQLNLQISHCTQFCLGLNRLYTAEA